MKWKIVIIAIIIVVLLSAGVVGFMWFKNSRGKVVNDGTVGIANFKNIGSYESGFGVDIDAGEFPIGIELLKGSLNIRITRNNEVIFEETNIEESENIVANIPETGYYFIMLSGNDAVGSLNYPVSQTANVPEVVNMDYDADQEIVKNVITDHFKKEYGDVVEEINFTDIKVYTKEEIENMEMLKELNLGEFDHAFEIGYELKIKEGYDNIMEFTAATGEIDGQWVKEKYNCGVAKYNSETDEYYLTDFGTSF